MEKLRTSVDHDGQAFIDEPVYRTVSRPLPAAEAIAGAFGVPGPSKIETVTHHERIRLRWMKPVRKNGEFVRNPDGTIKLEPR